jgi:hypothetical protein
MLFCCVQAFAWSWDAPAAYQPAAHELAPDPYSSSFVLAADPYPIPSGTGQSRSRVNRPARLARSSARLAPSPYGPGRAGLAPMPYQGQLPERELARPSAQALALAGSPYEHAASRDLAPDPY